MPLNDYTLSDAVADLYAQAKSAESLAKGISPGNSPKVRYYIGKASTLAQAARILEEIVGGKE